MIKENIKKNKGFVILFAVTLSSILLAIALGVVNISTGELKFSTSAQKTNEAFFAADTGIEYVLFNDKSTGSSYVLVPPETEHIWQDVFTELGSEGQSCAIVETTKDITTNPPFTTTKIISKGYNVGDAITCGSENSDRVEREIEVSY